MCDRIPATITHLILAGGGPSFIQTLGTLARVFPDAAAASADPMQNIRAIYACSAGAICAIFFCLVRHHRANPPAIPEATCTWSAIHDYIIGRPWEDLFAINAARLFAAFTARGLFDQRTLETVFASFFDVLEIPLDITLGEFYLRIAPIELHFFTFELHSFALVDVSHLTHPDVPLFEALHMTCSLPVFMTPVLRAGAVAPATTTTATAHECYMDGGVITNYPLRQCLAAGASPDAILGFKNVYDQADKSTPAVARSCVPPMPGHHNFSTRTVTTQSTLFDYFVAFVFRMIDRIKDPEDMEIPYEIQTPTEYMNIHNVTLAVGSGEMREKMWAFGGQIGRGWLDNRASVISDKD